MIKLQDKIVGIKNELKTLKRLVYKKAYDFSGNASQDQTLIDQFTNLVYDSAILGKGWNTSTWLGSPALKLPNDLWSYQEIIASIKPDLIIETGTAAGGSALYMASICDLIGKGHIISIDIEHRDDRPKHPRITYLLGSSTDPEMVEKVKFGIKPNDVVMVILDSDHSQTHVANELRIYSPFVTKGSYLIVEDTLVNGHPAAIHHGPGPMEALEEFLLTNKNFKTDREKEKFFLTFNPKGYLLKVL